MFAQEIQIVIIFIKHQDTSKHKIANLTNAEYFLFNLTLLCALYVYQI